MPSNRNCTPATPTSSDAVADTVTVPLTVAFAAGAVSATVGAGVDSGRGKHCAGETAESVARGDAQWIGGQQKTRLEALEDKRRVGGWIFDGRLSIRLLSRPSCPASDERPRKRLPT